MALTKEDLQAIQALLEPINTRLDKVDTQLDKVDTRLDTIQEDISGIKQRILKVEITQENIIIPNIRLIAEGIEGINDRLDRHDKLETIQEEHDHKIWALEQVVKAK